MNLHSRRMRQHYTGFYVKKPDFAINVHTILIFIVSHQPLVRRQAHDPNSLESNNRAATRRVSALDCPLLKE